MLMCLRVLKPSSTGRYAFKMWKINFHFVIPDTFNCTYLKLLDADTFVFHQGGPINFKLHWNFPSGVKHCRTEGHENRNWQNIWTCTHVDLTSYLHSRCCVWCNLWLPDFSPCSLCVFHIFSFSQTCRGHIYSKPHDYRPWKSNQGFVQSWTVVLYTVFDYCWVTLLF